MKKVLLLSFILICVTIQGVFAEKIPVKITPIQVISTNHDEVEIGDWINFETVNDIYVNNELYIRKGSPILGFVEFLHPNGWGGDSAEIEFKTFETRDVNGKKNIINYPLMINGNNAKNNDMKQYIAMVFLNLIRGSEIYIEPDTRIFNLFIER